MNIIAADVGGTNTRFVFSDMDRPRDILYEAHYNNADFDAFEPILKKFIDDSHAPGNATCHPQDAFSTRPNGPYAGSRTR